MGFPWGILQHDKVTVTKNEVIVYIDVMNTFFSELRGEQPQPS